MDVLRVRAEGNGAPPPDALRAMQEVEEEMEGEVLAQWR